MKSSMPELGTNAGVTTPANILRQIEQPKRALYRFLKSGFQGGQLKPGGKVVLVR